MLEIFDTPTIDKYDLDNFLEANGYYSSDTYELPFACDCYTNNSYVPLKCTKEHITYITQQINALTEDGDAPEDLIRAWQDELRLVNYFTGKIGYNTVLVHCYW